MKPSSNLREGTVCKKPWRKHLPILGTHCSNICLYRQLCYESEVGMKEKGRNIIKASQQHVWEYLNNPQVLAKAIPGCQEFEAIEENKYGGVIKLGVGPIKGEYNVKTSVVNSNPPTSFELHLEGSGLGGFINGIAHIQLESVDKDKTEVSWLGEAEAGGKLVAAGNRILVGVSKILIKQFFKSVENQILEGCSNGDS